MPFDAALVSSIVRRRQGGSVRVQESEGHVPSLPSSRSGLDVWGMIAHLAILLSADAPFLSNS